MLNWIGFGRKVKPDPAPIQHCLLSIFLSHWGLILTTPLFLLPSLKVCHPPSGIINKIGWKVKLFSSKFNKKVLDQRLQCKITLLPFLDRIVYGNRLLTGDTTKIKHKSNNGFVLVFLYNSICCARHGSRYLSHTGSKFF